MAVVMRGDLQCHLLVLLVGIINSMSEDLGDGKWISGPRVTTNWTKAEVACQGRDGHLFYETPTVGMDSLVDELEPGNVYWVGARVVSQPWIWDRTREHLYTSIGYSPASLVHSNEARSYPGEDDHQAFTCFVYCATHYIALQQTKCVCLINKPDLVSNSTDLCVTCPGNDNDHCGNSTGYSVYYDRLASTSKFRIVHNNTYSFIWAYLGKSEDGQISILSSNNSAEKRGFLCSKDRSTGSDHRLTGDARYSRREAAEVCMSRGTSLLQVAADTELRYDLPAGQYWIGLRRTYMWKWINGTALGRIPRSSSEGHQCVGIVKTSGVMTSSYSCSDKNRYICVIRRVKTLGISSRPQGTPSPSTVTPSLSTVTPVDWRIWVGLGVVGGALVICLVAAVLVLFIRYRKSHTACEKCTETGKSKLTPVIVEPRVSSALESEYSEVRDIIIGGTTPPPDVIAEEGVYSEPCRESGNFTGKIHPKIYVNVSSNSGNRNADTGSSSSIQVTADDGQILADDDAQYAAPETTAISTCEDPEDPGYNVPRVEVEYGVHTMTDSSGVLSTSLSSTHSAAMGTDLRYAIPRSASHSDTSSIGHSQSIGTADVKPQTKKKALINPGTTARWEPGRYDVPRSTESMDSVTHTGSGSKKPGCITGGHSLRSAAYDTSLNADQIYAVPKN